MELKDLQERIGELEKRVSWLETWVRRIVNVLKSAAGQLRGVDEKDESEK